VRLFTQRKRKLVLRQVRIRLRSGLIGIAPSPQAPLVLSQGERTSATATVPVQ
jgi:hypothetical protein